MSHLDESFHLTFIMYTVFYRFQSSVMYAIAFKFPFYFYNNSLKGRKGLVARGELTVFSGPEEGAEKER